MRASYTQNNSKSIVCVLIYTYMIHNLKGCVYRMCSVYFGGVLGMLDVADRVKPVEDIDIGRTRWAHEVLDETQRFIKLGILRCVGIFIPTIRGAQQCSDG